MILLIIGVYYYAGTKRQIKKYAMPEYRAETTGMKKIENLRLCMVGMDTINPLFSLNQNVQDVSKLIFEPLLKIDENYQIQPGLAKEWVKLNSTEYLIRLKENAIWQDGTKVTMQEVKENIEQIKGEEQSIYYKNVEDIQEIEIIDANIMKLSLKREIPFFEYQLTFPILSNHKQEKGIPMGTGPYKIAEKTEKTIILEKNLNYNQEETIGGIQKIEIYLYDSVGTAYQKFKEGAIDLLITSNVNIEDYIGSMGYHSTSFCDRQYDFLACNTQNGILTRKEVRNAIAYGINKQEIVETVYRGKYQIANSLLDIGSYLNIKQEGNYQPEKAKETLRQAGWEEVEGRWQIEEEGEKTQLELNLTVCEENEARIQVAEMIKNQLEQLGIPIQLEILSKEQYNQCIQTKDYELLLAGMQISFAPDMNGYLGEGNLANFYQEEVKEILAEVNHITEEAMLKQRYRRIQEILQEETPYIGLYMQTKNLIYQKKLKGNMNPTAYQVFNHMDTWYRQD